jgi:2-dehydropantoate 2-reductase
MRMAIVVVGAGAIGMLVAGRLAQAGQRVVLLARPALAEALAQQRLRISADGQVQAIDRIATITSSAELALADQPPEFAILCVKGYDTAGALPTLAALQPLYVLTLQNGIGNEELLAAQFGADRVISGAITTSVEVEAPGRIAVAKAGGIGIAPMGPGARAAATQAATVLGAAGFAMTEVSDYRALKWSKALLNMLGNATAAILAMSVAEVYANRRLLALERRAFREALAVMRRLGIAPVNLPRYPAALLATAMRTVPTPLLDPILRRVVAGGRGRKPPSLQLDLARGNPRSEGEFLYGAVASAAAAIGMAAPVNQALWDILQSITSGQTPWDEFRRQPDRLLAEIASRATSSNEKQLG